MFRILVHMGKGKESKRAIGIGITEEDIFKLRNQEFVLFKEEGFNPGFFIFFYEDNDDAVNNLEAILSDIPHELGLKGNSVPIKICSN